MTPENWTLIIQSIGSVALAIIAAVYMWEKRFDSKRYKEEADRLEATRAEFYRMKELEFEKKLEKIESEQDKTIQVLEEGIKEMKSLQDEIRRTATNVAKATLAIGERFKELKSKDENLDLEKIEGIEKKFEIVEKFINKDSNDST